MAKVFGVLADFASAADVPLELVLPSGHSPDSEPDLYLTYVIVPGAVTHASDGGGPYTTDYQLDIWVRGTEAEPDPVVAGADKAEAVILALDKITYQVLSPARPMGMDEDYSRTQIMLRRIHSL